MKYALEFNNRKITKSDELMNENERINFICKKIHSIDSDLTEIVDLTSLDEVIRDSKYAEELFKNYRDLKAYFYRRAFTTVEVS